MIAKNPAIPNKKSWFRGFLSRLKVFFSSPPPEEDLVLPEEAARMFEEFRKLVKAKEVKP